MTTVQIIAGFLLLVAAGAAVLYGPPTVRAMRLLHRNQRERKALLCRLDELERQLSPSEGPGSRPSAGNGADG